MTEAAHVSGQELFRHRFSDSVQPDAVCGHRFTESQLDPRVANLLSVQVSHSSHDRRDIGVLAKSVGVVVVVVIGGRRRGRRRRGIAAAATADYTTDTTGRSHGTSCTTSATLTLLLDVNLDDGPECLERGPQFSGRHVLLQIANEKRPSGFRVVFIQIGFQRPELVVVQVETRIPRCHFDFAAEKEFVSRHFERLVDIFGFLKSDNSHTIGTLAGHFDCHHFAVLFVLVEQAVFEAGVGRAQRQIADTNGQRSTVTIT